MSIPVDIKFRCRNCGKKITMEAWESINTEIPNVAHDIMTGELFAFTCPRCKCQDYVEYDMLYNDMNHNIMIQVLHDPDEITLAETKRVFSNMSTLAESDFRIVPNMNALSEKVTALEFGKDDRIVEICKYLCFVVFLQPQKPDFKLKRALYRADLEKNEDFFSFYGEAGEHMISPFDEPLTKLYNSAERLCLPAIMEECKGQYVFDYAWAENFVMTHGYLFDEDAAENTDEEAANNAGGIEDEDYWEEDADDYVDPYTEEEHQLIQPLLDALLQIPPDFNYVDQQIEEKQLSPRLVTKLGYDYLSALHIEECENRGLDDTRDTTWEEVTKLPDKHSTYMYEVIDMLLEFGLDPNYYETGKRGFFLMVLVTCISNGFVAPDTLALLLEHGGNSDTIVDGWNLYDHVYNDLSFSMMCDNYERSTHLHNHSLAHCWFVLLGYGCYGTHDNGHPLEFRVRDSEGEDGYFDLKKLKNHRNYTLAKTQADNDGSPSTLSIIDKRTCWEVAREQKEITPVNIYKEVINTVTIKGTIILNPSVTESGKTAIFSVDVFQNPVIVRNPDNKNVIFCIAYDETAAKVSQELSAGDIVVVSGRIINQRQQAKDGTWRSSIQIRCDEVMKVEEE